MNNEIGRKLTSLTLMTIMIAGGMAVAIPGALPAAHAANANLFVSAENSQFDNYISGPQVIEIVVIDADINDTDQAKGEPDVTVNGKIIRMVQAVDGNWYGYFADKPSSITADGTSQVGGVGLDYGFLCDTVTAGNTIPQATKHSDNFFSDATGVWSNAPGCGTAFNSTNNNVVREAKDMNKNVGITDSNGQIGIEAGAWPFIQLYTLNPTGNVVIQYNKGGGAQTTTLTFDTVDQFAGAELDRSTYTRGAQVHVTITDEWLNIDPTDEDSWTFGTTGTGGGVNATTNYLVFDENGASIGDIPSNAGPANLLTGQLDNLMCEDNCRLLTNVDVQHKGAVFTVQDNEDSRTIPATGDTENPFDWETENGNMLGDVPITVTEQGPNSGVFGSYDEGDTSALRITDDAQRGTSASVDYNETPVTVLVGFSFGSIDIKPVDNEWNSGEEIPVTLVDGDANRNSRADEDLDLYNPDVALIPSLKTGDPFTLAENNDNDNAPLDAAYVNVTKAGNNIASVDGSSAADLVVQKFSKRGIITSSSTMVAGGLLVDLDATGEDLKQTVQTASNFHGFNFYNQDLRSFTNGKVTATILYGSDPFNNPTGATGIKLGSFATQSLNNISGFNSQIAAIGTGQHVALLLEFPANTTVDLKNAFVTDFFSFGFTDDGVEDNERVSNQIIRIEAEETGDNTSTFEGSLEYRMLNQLNILDAATYEDLSPIANDPTFIVMEDLTDEDSPRVNYLDLGADGVSTQISDQEEAPSHSGIVSFDGDSYKIADTVTVNLEDADLNVDSDLVDIYTVVPSTDFTEPARDKVGAAGLPVFSFGPLGRLMDITFDDVDWKKSETCTPEGGADEGLAASTFSLVETGKATGVFKGDFQVPSNWCRPGADAPETTTGLDMEVNYVDFRDASGEIIEVGDSAGIRANTGSVSLDRTVYPVPFGVPADFGLVSDSKIDSGARTPDNRSIFPIHKTGITDLADNGNFLSNGDLTIHVRVNDPDFDISASGEDQINLNNADASIGPVKISVKRGADTVILGYAGGPNAVDGTINVGEKLKGDGKVTIGELTIPANKGFQDGEIIDINQNGATTTAKATFNNTDSQVVQVSELTLVNKNEGFASQDVVLTDTASHTINGVFSDGNNDGNIDIGELSLKDTNVQFVNGTVTIKQALSPFSLMANATFADDQSRIDAGELHIINSPAGAGYVTGKVTLVGESSGASVAADFKDIPTVRQFGPITEIAPDAGIFEADVVIRYTDGPASTICPETTVFTPLDGSTGTGEINRFSTPSPDDKNYCILQGDILQVEYTDPADASGDVNTVTDSATFDLRNGVLQSDKSVYIIGSDMILTLIEPDFDLDNDAAETYDLDLIEWDSDAATVTMGNAMGQDVAAAFDPEPTDFRETGDSTGIFQIVVQIPEELQGQTLNRGEQAVLEYTDWGPSGSDFVGDNDQDVNLTIYTSNFGATVELDQKVYSWTDKVYITIVAPDHNFDSDLVDEIGNTDVDPIKVSTRGFDIDHYKLVETGTDTGIFTGEVILTGFTHDADGDPTTGDANGNDVVSRAPSGVGPTDGYLPSSDDDGITVSFEFSEDETVVGSALIRWNIGEVQWLEASYPASGTGVVRVIDPDMNLDPESVDNFGVDVWSDSDAGGIDLTVTETNEATGIFEGTVFFTTTDESSGHRLRVAEGDTVTARYQDNTLPDPYTRADELDITATSLIGTIVPPLERAPASNCRVVDAFGNTLSSVSVDQQVQITCDVANGQDREQPFAYLIQIQDANGVTVSLAWITGSLSPGQSFSPALSWIPDQTGSFDVTAFVWESVDNPTALSPPQDTSITVQ